MIFREYIRILLSEKQWSKGDSVQTLICGQTHKFIITSITPENIPTIITLHTTIEIESPQSATLSKLVSIPNISLKAYDRPHFMLSKIISMFLNEKSKSKAFSIKGVLVSGPPGCGKTTLVTYNAAINKLPLLIVNANSYSSVLL